MDDVLASFGNAIRAAQLVLEGDPVMNGTRQRIPAAGGKKGNSAGSYIGWQNGVRPAGSIENFLTGTKENWKYQRKIKIAPLSLEKIAEMAAQRERRAEELQAQYEDRALAAARRWGRAHDMVPGETTPYLDRKQVLAIGLRRDGENLLVPLRDVDGKLWSIQTIFPEKKALTQDAAPIDKVMSKGAKKAGNFHVLGEVRAGMPVLVAEGYATSATGYIATDYATVVAIDSGNLDAVVGAIKGRYPDSPILILGDDDRHGQRNVGREKAEAAAEKYQVGVVFPQFATEGKFTDFNDLHVSEGLDAVTLQVEQSLSIYLTRSRTMSKQDQSNRNTAGPLQELDVPPLDSKLDALTATERAAQPVPGQLAPAHTVENAIEMVPIEARLLDEIRENTHMMLSAPEGAVTISEAITLMADDLQLLDGIHTLEQRERALLLMYESCHAQEEYAAQFVDVAAPELQAEMAAAVQARKAELAAGEALDDKLQAGMQTKTNLAETAGNATGLVAVRGPDADQVTLDAKRMVVLEQTPADRHDLVEALDKSPAKVDKGARPSKDETVAAVADREDIWREVERIARRGESMMSGAELADREDIRREVERIARWDAAAPRVLPAGPNSTIVEVDRLYDALEAKAGDISTTRSDGSRDKYSNERLAAEGAIELIKAAEVSLCAEYSDDSECYRIEKAQARLTEVDAYKKLAAVQVGEARAAVAAERAKIVSDGQLQSSVKFDDERHQAAVEARRQNADTSAIRSGELPEGPLAEALMLRERLGVQQRREALASDRTDPEAAPAETAGNAIEMVEVRGLDAKQATQDAQRMVEISANANLMASAPKGGITPEEATILVTHDLKLLGEMTTPYLRERALWVMAESRNAQPTYKTQFTRLAPPELHQLMAAAVTARTAELREWDVVDRALKEGAQTNAESSQAGAPAPVAVLAALDAQTRKQLEDARQRDRKAVEHTIIEARQEVGKWTGANTIERVDAQERKPVAPAPVNLAKQATDLAADSPAPPASDPTLTIIPPEVEKVYLRDGHKFYHPKNQQRVAFEDHGKQLKTAQSTGPVAMAMVQIAAARGWKEIKVSGTEEFRKEAWREAALRGIGVQGYKPTALDLADLARRTPKKDVENHVAPTLQATQHGAYINADDAALLAAVKAAGWGTAQAPAAAPVAPSAAPARTAAPVAHAAPAKPASAAAQGDVLVAHGAARYEHNKDNPMSYFVTMANDQGKQRTIWGVKLGEAIENSGVKPGDRISLIKNGETQVEVDANVKNDMGVVIAKEKIGAKRNEWAVKAHAFATQPAEQVVQVHKDLAGVVAIAAAIDQQAQADGYKPNERAYIEQRVREIARRSIASGNAPTLLYREAVESSKQPQQQLMQ